MGTNSSTSVETNRPSKPVQVGKPFRIDAYAAPKSSLFDIPLSVEKGFPQVKAIQPWIPGVSTPEGTLLSASVSVMLLNAVLTGGDATLKVFEGIATATFALVLTAIPTSVTFLSTQVLYPRK